MCSSFLYNIQCVTEMQRRFPATACSCRLVILTQHTTGVTWLGPPKLSSWRLRTEMPYLYAARYTSRIAFKAGAKRCSGSSLAELLLAAPDTYPFARIEATLLSVVSSMSKTIMSVPSCLKVFCAVKYLMASSLMLAKSAQYCPSPCSDVVHGHLLDCFHQCHLLRAHTARLPSSPREE
jgi:hypothetical protein